ncbi:hypothetical protein WICMUC_004470 [Wickerhamomyces mucosus]|uniref:XPG-I domain-containing protein n=1 Tax=Wickerhamomyces mucosus TaxID=1378264 RepID=A0A9P8PIN5_9ASCO|nr:hypothetical protein WICMUC_004470 [Wickerhamomyces mucosus]
MGVPAIWDIIKPGFDERIPFKVLVKDFYLKHKRPIKLAIDGHIWFFEAARPISISDNNSNNNNYSNVNNKLMDINISSMVINFHKKLRDLIELNVSFIIVFDGCFKPSIKNKKLNQYTTKSLNFDQYYRDCQNLINVKSVEIDDTDEIKILKKMLKNFNIDYVTAPSDAEAEASNLQKLGIVDYVISNDSDVLINGCTAILRNFSKFELDQGVTSIKNSQRSKHWWVTPVHIEKVSNLTGLDSNRLLLFSILVGADYNAAGLEGIGVEKAKQIVLSGTKFVKRHNPDFNYDMDFTSMFIDGFKHNSPSLDTRLHRYQQFHQQLCTVVGSNIKNYFGRNEAGNILNFYRSFENFPSDFVIMCYIKPFLSTVPYQFNDLTTNNAESTHPLTVFAKQNHMETIRFLEDRRVIDNPPVNDYIQWLNEGLSIAYISRGIIHEMKLPIRIMNEKEEQLGDHTIKLLGVKGFLFCNFKEQSTEINLESNKSLKLTWIMEELIPKTNRYYQDYLDYKEEQESIKLLKEQEKLAKKTSPRKSPRKSPAKNKQSNSLASMNFIPNEFTSPTKKSNKSPLKSNSFFMPLINKNLEPPPPSFNLSPRRKRIAQPVKHNQSNDIVSLIENSPKKRDRSYDIINLDSSPKDESNQSKPLKLPRYDTIYLGSSSPERPTELQLLQPRDNNETYNLKQPGRTHIPIEIEQSVSKASESRPSSPIKKGVFLKPSTYIPLERKPPSPKRSESQISIDLTTPEEKKYLPETNEVVYLDDTNKKDQSIDISKKKLNFKDDQEYSVISLGSDI